MLFCGAGWGFCQDAEPSEEPPAKKDLGRWWTKSALAYDPLPTSFLWHFQCTYNLTLETGTLEKNNHEIDAALALRKWRFTDYVNLFYERYDVHYHDNQVRDEINMEFSNALRYALTKRVYPEAGFMWSRSDENQIDNEYVYYLGAGYHLVDMETFDAKVFGALGYDQVEYMNGFEDDDYNVVFLRETINWRITERITAKHSGFRIQDLADRKRYRWRLAVSLDVKIGTYVSFVPRFQVNHDNAPVSRDIDKTETALDIGVRISF
jgi:hypothetical protein